MNNQQKLSAVGIALFGAEYKAPLAAKLGVNERTVRRWIGEEFEVNSGVIAELPRLIRERQTELRHIARILAYSDLIENGALNAAHLEAALQDEMAAYPADDKSDLSDAVHEWIEQNVKVDWSDELCDTVNDYINSRFE